MTSKPAWTLSPADLQDSPVWRYKAEESLLVGEDESWVEPASHVPPAESYGYFVGTTVVLANATHEVVLIGNTEPGNPKLNELLQIFVFFRGGRQFRWSEAEGNSEALAEFLGISLEAIFPFEYDLSRFYSGEASVLIRSVGARGTTSDV